MVRGCWNRFTPPPGAGNWSVRAFRYGAKSVFRRVTRVTLRGEVLPLGFRAGILADETVILEIKAVPALLPVPDMQ